MFPLLRTPSGFATPSRGPTGDVLLSFVSDETTTRPGGFVLEWTLQEMQPPAQPAAQSHTPGTVQVPRGPHGQAGSVQT